MKPLFTLSGVVQHGQNRGKKLGFPTLNFQVAHSLVEGIFVSHAIIKDKTYNALTFIGAAKTYNETLYQAETYVFEFDQEIYGETVTIIILKKLRDNEKFTSEEALITQMEEDKKQAEAFFKNS